jgi:hypothetical protein
MADCDDLRHIVGHLRSVVAPLLVGVVPAAAGFAWSRASAVPAAVFTAAQPEQGRSVNRRSGAGCRAADLAVTAVVIVSIAPGRP